MSEVTNQLKAQFDQFLTENEKFESGNNAAGTRARKALAEMAKSIKARRNEITAEKNARNLAKQQK